MIVRSVHYRSEPRDVALTPLQIAFCGLSHVTGIDQTVRSASDGERRVALSAG